MYTLCILVSVCFPIINLQLKPIKPTEDFLSCIFTQFLTVECCSETLSIHLTETKLAPMLGRKLKGALACGEMTQSSTSVISPFLPLPCHYTIMQEIAITDSRLYLRIERFYFVLKNKKKTTILLSNVSIRSDEKSFSSYDFHQFCCSHSTLVCVSQP